MFVRFWSFLISFQTNKQREKVCTDIIAEADAKMNEQCESSAKNQNHLIELTKVMMSRSIVS